MVRAEPWATNMDREESNISHKIEDSILHVTVEGTVKLSDIAAYANNHIDVWARSPRMIWDVRRMRFYDVSTERLRELVNGLAEVGSLRAGWRTALVFSQNEHLLGQLVADLAEAFGGPVEVQLFTSVDEAQGWLRSE